MKEEFLKYSEALALKKLGFDEQCFGYYENQDKNLVINYNNLPLTKEQQKRPSLYTIDNRNSKIPQWATAAPTYHQAFMWIRKKYKLHGEVFSCYKLDNKYNPIGNEWEFFIHDLSKVEDGMSYSKTYKIHKKAEIACIKKLIKFAKNYSK